MTRPAVNSVICGTTIGIGVDVIRPPWLKTVWLLTAFGVVCIIAITALIYAYVGERKSDRTSVAVQGSCQFWHDLSQLPLSDSSTKVAFTIIADARIAYAHQGCTALTGSLPLPDPRVVPFLPPGVR